jgi:hypothetical protein
MKWFFQKESIGSDREKLQAACKRQGIEFRELEYYNPDYPWDLFDVQGVCYGSINFCKYCYKYPVYPGPICTWKNYECTSYYSRLGKYLLSQNYCMLTWGEFKRQMQDWKTNHLGNLSNCACLFIRPNKGDKKFVGQVIDCDKFNPDKVGIEEIEPDELIVVAEPRNIFAEYRFVILNGELLTGSRYKSNGKLSTVKCEQSVLTDCYFRSYRPEDDSSACYAAEAADLAREIAKIYQPDDVFVIDIAKAKDGYFLLELNAFSCSGFYDCDHDLIVKEVSKYAKTIPVP